MEELVCGSVLFVAVLGSADWIGLGSARQERTSTVFWAAFWSAWRCVLSMVVVLDLDCDEKKWDDLDT